MSHKTTDSEEEQLLPRPQQTTPQYQQFYPISQPSQYGQSSVQVPGTAFIGPYPNVANAGVPQYPPPYLHGSSNQMQQVVVVGQQQQPQVVIAPPAPRTYTWHIVLSCIVFWFCGWICGAIAFALAGQHLTFLHPFFLRSFLPSFHPPILPSVHPSFLPSV